jgi:hypothetical protein
MTMYDALKKLRQHLGAHDGACLKKPYNNREEAEEHAAYIHRKFHAPLQHAYRCWCGAWHLTTKRS